MLRLLPLIIICFMVSGCPSSNPVTIEEPGANKPSISPGAVTLSERTEVEEPYQTDWTFGKRDGQYIQTTVRCKVAKAHIISGGLESRTIIECEDGDVVLVKTELGVGPGWIIEITGDFYPETQVLTSAMFSDGISMRVIDKGTGTKER